MTDLLAAGFTDTWRYFYPDVTGIYSWWSYRFKARQNNAGWRIDYFITSKSLDNKLKKPLFIQISPAATTALSVWNYYEIT